MIKPPENLSLLLNSVKNDRSSRALDLVIKYFKETDVAADAIAFLARSLAESGTILENSGEPSADIASTGGPSSLSTLLCPLFLREYGLKVPKLGVPGRPAGGIDVLATIPGFAPELTRQEIRAALRDFGYAHFLANRDYAPLDAELFHRRRETGATAVPSLVVASLLSKKLAVGLTTAGLDIRVLPKGNFGATPREASDNARLFCRVSERVGVASKCFLTDASQAYQPFIGRGESLLALSEIFEGSCSGDLEAHLVLCQRMAQAVASPVPAVELSTVELRKAFADHLKVQGSSYDAFCRRVEHLKAQPAHPVIAQREGYVSVDMAKIRSVIVAEQRRVATEADPFPDPCGLTLSLEDGRIFSKGEKIAQVRLGHKSMKSRVLQGLTKAFSYSVDLTRALPKKNIILEQVVG